MEGSDPGVIVEGATPLSLDVCVKHVAAVTGERETAVNSARLSHASADVRVTLENESVWSRFHSLGTEMILTKQGRRMFPCCRFRLSGLDPARSYSLIMSIVPVNEFTHTWSGGTWEPMASGEPHEPGNVCVHPESPAPGSRWMESPVSFYKVKLTSECTDQEDCVRLRPMHRYQPRLHVVPADAPDGPGAEAFAFPLTEFYAVTSYQNPQITQLKIDCNPFAMAFREDSKSIRLVQNRFQLRATAAAHLRSPVLSLARSLSMKRKDAALKNAAAACPEDGSDKGPAPSPAKRSKAQTSLTDIISSEGTSACGLNETHPAPVEDEEPSENGPLPERLQSGEEAVLPLCNPDASERTSHAANASPDSMADDLSQVEENLELDYVDHSPGSQCSDPVPQEPPEDKTAKSKWWSDVKSARHHPETTTPNMSLQPDIDDVEGVLFVSFGTKNPLNNDVENVEQRVTPLPSPSLDGSDNHDTEDARISKLESVLLHDLQEMKHRQVIHPLLQDVGMKLSLLNPTSAIDLQYLGVQLPFPSPVHNSFLSPDATCLFVSRTGKTNDPTKIKGWREKFSPTQSAPEGPRVSSAFCSDMLDEYLEKEAQQISNRVAVFSTGSTLPVSYQLPSKSSSYIVTLDSRLKTQTKARSSLSKPQETDGDPQAQAHALRSSGSSPKPAVNKLPENCQSTAGMPSCNSGARFPLTSAKIYSHVLIKDMEAEAVHKGKGHTHITAQRAKFALCALLNFQKWKKRRKYRAQHQGGCSKDFCRLGCVCDSLHRETRGPTHCRRADCMFECKCFKHRVLLWPPGDEAAVQRGKKRGFLVLPGRDTESEDRPPPAPSITTLWEKTTDDPDPVFIPTPASPPKKFPGFQPIHQIPQEDKDPVYLYFESMMTCARVREFDSNPPMQIHMVPVRKTTKETKQLSPLSEAGESRTSEKTSADPPAVAAANAGEPEPTKLLEILSQCNWEPHRNLVLSALFRQMNSSLLSEPFFIGKYKVQLLSTTYKHGERSTTVTYKVCVSHAKENEVNAGLQMDAKRTRARGAFPEDDPTDSAAVDSQRRGSGFVIKPPRKLFSLISHVSLPGYLKADKKKAARPALGLIRVNGKMYNQAKLLLGQLGALHPVNRYAAFVTGRLQHEDQHRPKSVHVSKSTPATSRLAGVKPEHKRDRGSNFAPRTVRSMLARRRLSQLDNAPPASATKRLVLDGSKLVLPPTNPPAVPPGVLLQPAPGTAESGFLCQYNGQMVKLVPVNQPRPCPVREGSPSQTPDTTDSSKATASTPKPLISTIVTNSPPKVFPVITPRMLSLSGSSGMNIANGIPAIKLQSGFSGKPGTFSFRIYPPNNEAQSVPSVQDAKPAHPVAGAPSTLMLPGGFTLIKIEPLPINPANVSTVSNAAVIVQKDQCVNKSFSRSEDTCRNSETSNSDVREMTPLDLSHGNDTFPSKDVNRCEPVEQKREPVSTVPDQVALQSQNGDMHDEPPNAAVQISCAEEVVSADTDEVHLNMENDDGAEASAGSPADLESRGSAVTRTGGVEEETSGGPTAGPAPTPERIESPRSPRGAAARRNQREVRDLLHDMVKIAKAPGESASFDVFELRVQGVYTETSQKCPHPKPGEGGGGTTSDPNGTADPSLEPRTGSPAAPEVQTGVREDKRSAKSLLVEPRSDPPVTECPPPNQQSLNRVHNKRGSPDTGLSGDPVQTPKQAKDDDKKINVVKLTGSRPTMHHNTDAAELSEEDSSDYCTEHSGYHSTSDGEETMSSSGPSSDEDGVVDVVSVEGRRERMLVTRMEAEARTEENSKKACTFEGGASDVARRQTHTENERQRRVEIQQHFGLLRKALDIGDKLKLSKHDLLNQARLMILALEGRNQNLEERKNALLQRRLTYLAKIAELSADTKSTNQTHFMKTCEQRKQSEVQNQLQNDPDKRSKDSGQPSVPLTASVSSLPNIVLQSFQKPETVTSEHDVLALHPTSTESSTSPEPAAGRDVNMQVGISNNTDATRLETVSEHPSREDPGSSPVVHHLHDGSRSDLDSATRAEIPTRKEASSNAEALGSKLRLRSPVGTRMATRSTPTQKRKRFR